jgi:cytochrome c553
MTRRRVSAAMLALIVGVAACVWLPVVAATGPAEPPSVLADTGLYAGGRVDVIDVRNRPFAPQYPLWSDGLLKRRWIQLPAGAAIDARDPYSWSFPVGTKLWKEFSFEGRKIETRMLWKASDAGWITAVYAWNDDGTEAVLAPAEGLLTDVEVVPGRRHVIPARTDCAACHGGKPAPLGVNALQLSADRDPNAIHGEPLEAGMVTLQTLVDDGLLRDLPADLMSRPPRIATSSPETRAILGYLVTNCGNCHNGSGEISASAPVLIYRELLEDGDTVARRLVGHRTKWQVPGVADGESVLVQPGHPDASALLVRMRSRAPSSQMPPLGTVMRDQEALDAITRWIQSEVASAH